MAREEKKEDENRLKNEDHKKKKVEHSNILGDIKKIKTVGDIKSILLRMHQNGRLD